MTPFDGRNPKVGVNHVHFCLSPFHVFECLFYPFFMCLNVYFVTLFDIHVMLNCNLVNGFAIVEDKQEELLYYLNTLR